MPALNWAMAYMVVVALVVAVALPQMGQLVLDLAACMEQGVVAVTMVGVATIVLLKQHQARARTASSS
jgi:hypothetical protein